MIIISNVMVARYPSQDRLLIIIVHNHNVISFSTSLVLPYLGRSISGFTFTKSFTNLLQRAYSDVVIVMFIPMVLPTNVLNVASGDAFAFDVLHCLISPNTRDMKTPFPIIIWVIPKGNIIISLIAIIAIIQNVIIVISVRKKGIPAIGFTFCEICNTSAHSKCVVGEYSFIKPGGIYKEWEGHPHPLTFVQKLHLYPECNKCGNLCFDLALECNHSDCTYIVHWNCIKLREL
ncbi:hypothetical protein COLO4_14900 [Corchorus olitorius]|uniref:DC1 domain-containing protein n=1 Tax=Corchorus olitorius TaxID=93759 RepID=A0A1R3JQP8_9ROSI|nr:hypothetical protein COLO4_14900 [Corchorus olitorius]